MPFGSICEDMCWTTLDGFHNTSSHKTGSHQSLFLIKQYVENNVM